MQSIREVRIMRRLQQICFIKEHHIFFYKMADMTGDAIFSYLLLFSFFGYIFFSFFFLDF